MLSIRIKISQTTRALGVTRQLEVTVPRCHSRFAASALAESLVLQGLLPSLP